MKLTNIGGATAILESGGRRLLFDPWLDEGIFHGAWHHFPPAQLGIDDLGRLDFVYISHIHEDHCSAGTIRHLNRDAELILMDREPNYVLRFIESNGFEFRKIHLVAPRQPQQIAPGIVVDMVEPDPSNSMSAAIDSMLWLEWDGTTVFNANDCQVWPGAVEYLKSEHRPIDVALLPYSGGSGYPACYLNLSDDEKSAEVERILTMRMRAFVETVRQLEPRYALPFADQYVVGGSRAALNRFVAHPPEPGAVLPFMQEAGLEDTLVLLNSGQTIDIESGERTPNEPFRRYTVDERQSYVDGLASNKYDHERITFAPGVPIERLLGHARARMWQQQQRAGFSKRFNLYLDLRDGTKRARIDLDAEGLRFVDWNEPLEEPYLRIAASETLWAMLLIGHVSWNIADAALFLDYERRPNVYDPDVYVYLNHLRV
jgi:UDP-MurNAc hydroxylase